MLEKARIENSEKELIRALKLFKCFKDPDIEDFLHNKAIDFLDRNICRIYLILNEDDFNAGKLKIEAFFTLSFRSLSFEPEVSKTTIRKITGFKNRKTTEFVLIGQLGKYIERYSDNEIVKSEITVSSILDYAFEVVLSVNEWIPCNTVLVECSEAIHNKGIYQNEGFSLLQIDNGFYQYYKRIV